MPPEAAGYQQLCPLEIRRMARGEASPRDGAQPHSLRTKVRGQREPTSEFVGVLRTFGYV